MAARKKKNRPESDPNVFWMIRRKTDGLYSKGNGGTPCFGTDGRMWNSQARMLAHMKLVDRAVKHMIEYRERYRKQYPTASDGWYDQPVIHPYLQCEVVQFRRVEEAKADVLGYGE